MLALLAIAFGKDMASATVISLEPFLEATQPSLNKHDEEALPSPSLPPPPPPPAQAAAPPAAAVTATLGTGVGGTDHADPGHASGALKDTPPGATTSLSTTAAGASVGAADTATTKIENGRGGGTRTGVV